MGRFLTANEIQGGLPKDWWNDTIEGLEKQDRLTEHLYGDLSMFPRWLNRMLSLHAADACDEAWVTLMQKMCEWRGGRFNPAPPLDDYRLSFTNNELVDWNRQMFDPRGERFDWRDTPRVIWEHLLHPTLRADALERCRHCNIPSLLLRRCALCREVKYCSTDCQQKSWNLDHKSTCRRTWFAR
ncbi:hypothetical protein AURDEDRAFT_111652, partial [Auricularia subglabra TFB-10046 SS5]